MNKKLFWIPIGIIIIILILWPNPKGPRGGRFLAKIPVVESTKAKVSGLDLFIDFSGSMRGYIDFSGLPNSSEAKNTMLSTVTTFLDNVESNYQINTVSYCGKKTYAKDVFRQAMQNKSIFNAGTTLLQQMIAEASVKAGKTNVVAIVSDMILSYGRTKILAENDTAYNKHHLDELGGAIHSAMSSVKSKGLDVILLQYYSSFNGNYYYNYTENLKGLASYKGILMKDRPFYILLIGEKDCLKSILNKDCLKESENVYSSFGLEAGDMKPIDYIINEENSSYWAKGNDEGEDGVFWTTSNLGTEKTKFKIECNDFKVPSYINKRSISVKVNESIESVDISKIHYDEQYSSLTLVVNLKPFNQLKKEGTAEFSVISSNSWKDNVNIDNDVAQAVDKIERRTWGFGTILSFIDLAFHGKQKTDGETIAEFSFGYSKY